MDRIPVAQSEGTALRVIAALGPASSRQRASVRDEDEARRGQLLAGRARGAARRWVSREWSVSHGSPGPTPRRGRLARFELGVLVVLAKLRSRMTYANVVATIALFVALGGSSYAALKVTGRNVPKDALTGADIKNLTGRDVINNSLTGADVKNLTSADVTNGKLLAEDFAPGQLPKGETGATGPAGSALAYAHINADGTVDQANSKNVTVPLSAPGQYCLDVTTGERPHNVVASIDAAVGNSGVYDGIAPTLVPDFVAAACAPSTTADAYVDTRDRTSAFPTRAAKPFYVVFN